MTRFEETGIAMGDPDADLDALLEEQAALQAKIEDADAWNLQVDYISCSQPSFLVYLCRRRLGRARWGSRRSFSLHGLRDATRWATCVRVGFCTDDGWWDVRNKTKQK